MSWPEIHGALTHFPVALLITACAFEIGALLFRHPVWRAVSFWLLVGTVVMAVPTIIAGWVTGDELYGGIAQPPLDFVWHRAVALGAAGLAVALLIWRLVVRDRLAGGALLGEVVGLCLAAGLVGAAGYLGGHMVFAAAGAPIAHPSPAPKALTRALPSQLEPGLRTYRQFCVRCHGVGGDGGVGPRLAGASLSEKEIKKDVMEGIPPVMPAFGGQLSPTQVNAITSYIHWLSARPEEEGSG